jgi:hypothetical protein
MVAAHRRLREPAPPARAPRRELLERVASWRATALDGRRRVVELVRDAGRQRPELRHLLGLPQHRRRSQRQRASTVRNMTRAAEALALDQLSSSVLWTASSLAARARRAVALRGTISSSAVSADDGQPEVRTASSTSRPDEIFTISISPSAMT